jgi:D-glycero-alpha-D-manno-heptose 1-phosphate guanylyltransferase
MPTLSDIDAVVLVGGQGTRLRAVVADRPKPLAEVGGRPFLKYLLDFLAAAGIRRATLCSGYRAGMIRAALGDRYGSLRLRYSEEAQPLGTAGAVLAALPTLESSTVLVANGDSLCQADLGAFLRFHQQRGSAATLLLTHADDCSRFGQVLCDDQQRIVSFAEKKQTAGPGWINAGVYLIERSALEVFPAGPLSFEHDVFAAPAAGFTLHGWPGGGAFVDIGTPESLAQAERLLPCIQNGRFWSASRSLATSATDSSASPAERAA